MAVRYIFNTSGDYVAFIQGQYLFDPNCEWLGVVVNRNEAYNADGEFLGIVLDDDRIVKHRHERRARLTRPARPMRPTRPMRPMRRLRMGRLPFPYEDVFSH